MFTTSRGSSNRSSYIRDNALPHGLYGKIRSTSNRFRLTTKPPVNGRRNRFGTSRSAVSADIIIRQQHTAQVGEIVVALTDEDKNTLKRLLYDDDRQSYYLHPENKDMEDIYVSGLRVQGVATHVIKAL